MDLLDEISNEIDEFPTLPDVVVRVCDALADDDVSLAEIADMVSLDQNLAGRIVKLANSPIFGASRPAESLSPAIFRLGVREVRSVVLTTGVMHVVPKLPAPYDLRTFWTFALASAMTSRALAEDLGPDDPEEAYLAGLVHLIGEVLLAVRFTERFQVAIETARSDGLPFAVALTEEFGFDHAEVGAKILERWYFPLPILEAVRSQFTPDRAQGDARLAGIVFAADHICRDVGFGLLDPTYVAGAWMERLPEVLSALARERGHDFSTSVKSAEARMGEIQEFARSVFSG